MSITKEDDRFGVLKLELDEEILHLDRVIAIALVLDDVLKCFELSDLCSGFNILVVNLVIVGVVEDRAKEVVDALVAST